MTGLEKIIYKIEQDCEADCESILKAAKEQAAEILKTAKTAAETKKAEMIAVAHKKSETETELAVSRAELEGKKKLLFIKINLVNNIIDEAVTTLKTMPADLYFGSLLSLIQSNARKESASLRFSDWDLKRLPEKFETQINAGLTEGASVKISSEPAPIESGFVLVYDDIEQNCSFEALLNDKMDHIKDSLYALLFAGESV